MRGQELDIYDTDTQHFMIDMDFPYHYVSVADLVIVIVNKSMLFHSLLFPVYSSRASNQQVSGKSCDPTRTVSRRCLRQESNQLLNQPTTMQTSGKFIK